MAYIGKWGCFIHIPKTSGVWVKEVLKSEDDVGKYDGITHGLPTDWNKHGQYWTVVRDPAEYLASVWAHLWRNGWDTYPRRVPWQTFVELLRPYQTEDFDEFIESVVTFRRGIVGWFFTVHTPPPVIPIRFGQDLYTFLKGMGYRPEEVPKRNMGINVPELAERHRRKIRESEKEAYAKWKF